MIGKPSCPVPRGEGRRKTTLLPAWLKQNLHIRTFFGTTPNAVRVQLWSAIATYLAVAIARKELGLPHSLTTVLQIISVNAFQKVPLAELFAEVDESATSLDMTNQLTLNGF